MKTLNLVMTLRMMKSVRLHCLQNIKLKGRLSHPIVPVNIFHYRFMSYLSKLLFYDGSSLLKTIFRPKNDESSFHGKNKYGKSASTKKRKIGKQ